MKPNAAGFSCAGPWHPPEITAPTASLWLPAMVWAIMPPRLYLQFKQSRGARLASASMGQPACAVHFFVR